MLIPCSPKHPCSGRKEVYTTDISKGKSALRIWPLSSFQGLTMPSWPKPTSPGGIHSKYVEDVGPLSRAKLAPITVSRPKQAILTPSKLDPAQYCHPGPPISSWLHRRGSPPIILPRPDPTILTHSKLARGPGQAILAGDTKPEGNYERIFSSKSIT